MRANSVCTAPPQSRTNMDERGLQRPETFFQSLINSIDAILMQMVLIQSKKSTAKAREETDSRPSPFYKAP